MEIHIRIMEPATWVDQGPTRLCGRWPRDERGIYGGSPPPGGEVFEPKPYILASYQLNYHLLHLCGDVTVASKQADQEVDVKQAGKW